MADIISPNMLKTFLQCPKKFFFRYKKGIQFPVNEDVYVMGKNIHALASYYLKKENIDNLILSLSDKERAMWDYLKDIKYFSYEVINTEYNLSVKVGDYYYGGRLDALVKKDNIYYILDYKTGSVPQDPKYDFQTIVYALAVSDFYKTENVVFTYIDIKSKSFVEIPLTTDLISEYKTKLMDISKRLDKSDYQALSADCRQCEYKVICYDKKLHN